MYDLTHPIPSSLNPATNPAGLGNFHVLFPSTGISDMEHGLLEKLAQTKRRLRIGECLYRTGEGFFFLYIIRSGFFKTTLIDKEGREQITGFHMSGEMMGIDGIATDIHACSAFALENSEVCLIPYQQLENTDQSSEAFQHFLRKALSHEITRDENMMMLLGTMRANERVAAFLLYLSQSYLARGFSRYEFYLRMSRAEIANYLGLKIETVSRILSSFQSMGCIETQQKHIVIHDLEKLKHLDSKNMTRSHPLS
ncbi:MAG TPA: helix-turn-helix domain-containing protein [Burkholderiales bacterium]|nr:helix-turn-helix domain-containing protein [Burkholderiales bacterium]